MLAMDFHDMLCTQAAPESAAPTGNDESAPLALQDNHDDNKNVFDELMPCNDDMEKNCIVEESITDGSSEPVGNGPEEDHPFLLLTQLTQPAFSSSTTTTNSAVEDQAKARNAVTRASAPPIMTQDPTILVNHGTEAHESAMDCEPIMDMSGADEAASMAIVQYDARNDKKELAQESAEKVQESETAQDMPCEPTETRLGEEETPLKPQQAGDDEASRMQVSTNRPANARKDPPGTDNAVDTIENPTNAPAKVNDPSLAECGAQKQDDGVETRQGTLSPSNKEITCPESSAMELDSDKTSNKEELLETQQKDSIQSNRSSRQASTTATSNEAQSHRRKMNSPASQSDLVQSTKSDSTHTTRSNRAGTAVASTETQSHRRKVDSPSQSVLLQATTSHSTRSSKRSQNSKYSQARTPRSNSSKSSRSHRKSFKGTTSPSDSLSLTGESFTPDTKIIQFREVKKIFEKGGFQFAKNLFCRPGTNPKNLGESIHGTDWFRTEDEFRKYLCENFVDDFGGWNDEEKKNINLWVRFAIVRSADLTEPLPTYKVIKSISQYLSLLKKAGYKKKLVSGLDMWCDPSGAERFNSDEDLTKHLARYGLPAWIDESVLPHEERLSLEVYLTEAISEYRETFITPSQISRRQRSNKKVASDTPSSMKRQVEPSEMTPVEQNRQKKIPRLADHGVTPDDKDQVLREAYLDSEKDSTKGSEATKPEKIHLLHTSPKAHVVVEDGDEQNPHLTVVDDSRQAETATNVVVDSSIVHNLPTSSVSPLPFSDSSNSGVQGSKNNIKKSVGSSSHSSQSTVVSVDSSASHSIVQLDNRTRLEQALKSLDLTKPIDWATLIGPKLKETSQLRKNINSVTPFLKNALDKRGRYGLDPQKPPILYVCGDPGVGKSTVVRCCCNQAIAEYGGQAKECYINAGHLSSVVDPMDYINEKIRDAAGIKGGIRQSFKKTGVMVLFILDEIENMLLSSSNDPPPSSTLENTLSELLKLADDDSFPFALIGISNSSGDEKFGRLQMMRKVRCNHVLESVAFSNITPGLPSLSICRWLLTED